jgi:hypothetical protein
MAWLNPFRKEDENTRHTYGYTFQWTPDHFTPEQMQPLKYSYDVIAEQALNKLDEISPPPDNALPRNQDRTAKTEAGKEKEPDFIPKRDLYALLRDHHEEDEVLDALWKQVNTVPDWVDWDQIARGQDVFYRYGEVALTTVSILLKLDFYITSVPLILFVHRMYLFIMNLGSQLGACYKP